MTGMTAPRPELADLYPLSTLQQGMLSHTLREPAGGVDIEQVIGSIRQELNVPVLREAWARAVARYDALRTAFRWKDLPEPMQYVLPFAEVPLEGEDWRALDAGEQERKFEEFLERDRERGLDPGVAPMLRLSLFRLREEEYKLVVTYHHAILDGRSFINVHRDVWAVYESLVQGVDLQLPPAPRYRDFIDWLKTKDPADSEGYWRETLKGFHAATTIDLPKRSSHRPARHEHPRILSVQTTAALAASAKANGCTLNTFVQAAWALLLARYTGEEDVVFGAVRACRYFPVPGAAQMAGLFINTLPMRAAVRPEMPLPELLKCMSAQQAALRDHEQTPLYLIQQWTGIAPLLRSIVIFQSTALKVSLGDPDHRDFILRERTGYPLTFYCFAGPQLSYRIAGSADYEPEDVARMSDHITVMLEAMAHHGDKPVGLLPMLTAAESAQFAQWNETRRDFSGPACVHGLVEAIARERPERAAVTFGGESLTYGELNARANQLARRLRAKGIKGGDLVGLCVERSAGMIVAMLGILKAGAAYVPLDPAYPRERIAYMIENSGTPLIITQERLAGELPAGKAAVLCLDAAWTEIARESAAELGETIPAESLAYVIYTSGSTGKPKGIGIEHRAAVNFLESMRREPGLGAEDTLLAVTTISFDIAALEIFLPLSTGAHLLLASRDDATDAARLAEMLRGATIMQATPATWRMLVQAGWRGSAKLKILCGGEAMAPELARQLLERCGELWNMYGPTETTIWSTCQRIERAEGLIPVGRPIANTTVYVLGKDGRQQPLNVAGELFIGGAGLARGYHGLPELTREKFIPDPFSADPGARLYATGDLSRFAPDGALEVIGRIDRQVKIRGFRIEAGEIETRLCEFPAVRQAAVADRTDATGEKILVAYYVSDPAKLPAADLRAFLAERLPAYMVPSAFVPMARLPLTPNGKVDYRALPEPDLSGGDASDQFTAPRGEIEEKLAAIWCEVLRRERVGVNDNFFEFGGHSLVATVLAMRIGSAFDIEFPLRRIFEQPTISAMAGLIEQLAPRQAAAPEAVRADPARAHEPFPLTELQQAYVAGRGEGFELGNIGLHAFFEFEPEGFDPARANAAVRHLIARHPMLRAVVNSDGTQQVLERLPEYSIELVDLRNQPAEAAVAAERERMSHQYFDLSAWPWFEIRALRLDETRYRLLVSYEAVMVDAWSANLLVREFATLMAGGSLPPLDTTFRDYVLAEGASRKSDTYQRAKQYWTERLPDLPAAPALPLAKSPAAIARPRFERHSTRLSPAQWERFKSNAAACEITPGLALIAAFAEVLARWSPSRHFSLSLPIFNRASLHPRINEVVGHFTTLSMLEIDLSGPASFQEHTRAIQQRFWSDLDHRAYNGVQVARDLARLRGEGRQRTPIVTANIMLEEGFQSALPGRAGYAITQTPQVLLDQMASVSGGGLILWWDAVAELFPGTMLDEMFAALCGLVSRLADDLDAWRTKGSPLRLPAAEIGHDTAPAAEETLHALFLKQVPLRGEAPAVITPTRTLGYGELHRRAARIAQLLGESGAKPNTLVAIVMEKGWEQVVAALGVLYSGAAYLPIEAGLPPARLAHLLRHGEVSVALTQSRRARQIEWPEGVRAICVDEEGEAPFDPAAIAAGLPGDLAYVIYTSGSTGLPKGVMTDHRGAVNTILDVNSRFAVTERDRVFALSSLSFDLSVYDLFGPLAAGGAIVMPAAEETRDPAHWAEMMAREGVTLWNSVPALMKLLAESASPRLQAAGANLRLALLSGDWIPLSLPAQIRKVAPKAEIISLGGATEASIWSILFPIREVDPSWTSIPYGKAMVNQSFHVLDKALDPCPAWVAGDLYIGGIGLAKGYWRDREKTDASFITHPATGERLYRTGDLGRRLPDGNIEFLGRADFQVKIQGLRIELGEIEAALLDHPGVSAAVVAARGERDGPKRLVAYIVAKDEPPPADALRDFLLARLPEYMVPLAFVALDALPLTPNGKIDRTALPEPELAKAAKKSLAPRNDLELKLVKIWEEVFGVANIGVQDDFFDLGGHSLLGMQIVSRIGKTFDKKLSLSSVIQARNVENLSALLRNAGRSSPLNTPIPIQPRGPRPVLARK